MKRFIFLLAILLSFSFTGIHAQSAGPYVSLDAGPSFPLFAFGQNAGDEAGHAKIGVLGTVGIGYQFARNVSFGLKGVFTQHTVNPEATIFPKDSPWKGNFLLADIRKTFMITEILGLEASLQGGASWVTFPEGSIEFGSTDINFNAGQGRGVAVGGGLHLRYVMDQYITFRFGGDYLRSAPTYEDNILTYQQRMAMFNLHAGLEFTL